MKSISPLIVTIEWYVMQTELDLNVEKKLIVSFRK